MLSFFTYPIMAKRSTTIVTQKVVRHPMKASRRNGSVTYLRYLSWFGVLIDIRRHIHKSSKTSTPHSIDHSCPTISVSYCSILAASTHAITTPSVTFLAHILR